MIWNGKLRRFVPIALLAACGMLLASPAVANITPSDGADDIEIFTEFAPVPIAGPFEFPWSIGFLPDGSILVTERPGRLQLVQPGREPRTVSGLPRILNVQLAGLLDVAVDPDFASNSTIYLSYVHGTPERSTVRVLRGRLDVARARLRKTSVIFESSGAPSTEQYGGRMALAGGGLLYLTLGDRWERERAQDLGNHVGSIVRIHTDGTVPDDNPFVSVPGAQPEIWSYGHRNPLGLAFDGETGRLWSHENGPQGGDELNLIEGGRNYGWPVITHGRDYSGEPIGEGVEKPGMEQPVRQWTPAIAPSGLALETVGGRTVFWIGALAGQALIRLVMEGDRIVGEQRLLENKMGRIRDVRLGPDGQLYVVNDDPEGALHRLDPVVAQAGRRIGGGL